MSARDKTDEVREAVITDLRRRLDWAYRIIAVAALAGVLGGAALAPVLRALVGDP